MRLNWLAEHIGEVIVWVEYKEEAMAFNNLVDNDYCLCKMTDEDLFHINAVLDRYIGE